MKLGTFKPEFRNCIAAKERKERKERSRGIMSVEKNLTVLLPSGSARFSLCSLRSLAANFGFQGKKFLAVLLLALSFSPTSLWACAACTGRTDSPLAVAMNWGILTLLCVVLTVLSGVLVFFVHVIRKEEKASHDAPPENSPKT